MPHDAARCRLAGDAVAVAAARRPAGRRRCRRRARTTASSRGWQVPRPSQVRPASRVGSAGRARRRRARRAGGVAAGSAPLPSHRAVGAAARRRPDRGTARSDPSAGGDWFAGARRCPASAHDMHCRCSASGSRRPARRSRSGTPAGRRRSRRGGLRPHEPLTHTPRAARSRRRPCRSTCTRRCRSGTGNRRSQPASRTCRRRRTSTRAVNWSCSSGSSRAGRASPEA